MIQIIIDTAEKIFPALFIDWVRDHPIKARNWECKVEKLISGDLLILKDKKPALLIENKFDADLLTSLNNRRLENELKKMVERFEGKKVLWLFNGVNTQTLQDQRRAFTLAQKYGVWLKGTDLPYQKEQIRSEYGQTAMSRFCCWVEQELKTIIPLHGLRPMNLKGFGLAQSLFALVDGLSLEECEILVALTKAKTWREFADRFNADFFFQAEYQMKMPSTRDKLFSKIKEALG